MTSSKEVTINFMKAAKGDYWDEEDDDCNRNKRYNMGNWMGNDSFWDDYHRDRKPGFWKRRDDDSNRCNQCLKEATSPYWCQPCNSSHFREESKTWKSGNNVIDEFITDVQLKATSSYKILEWIPYSKFENVKYLAEGGFGKVYSAVWSEGCILYWNARDSQWKRNGTTKVALKCLKDSQDITKGFLNEIQNLYNCNDQTSFITRCYGITRDDETNNFMIVMQFMEDGSIRENLSDFQEMSWNSKFTCFYRIAEGLSQMHSAELVHQDFHTGNILLSSTRKIMPYIADLGLNKPVKDFAENQKKVFGVLPYVAPEVLDGDEYTKASDVYALGVIMCEMISGTLPFKDRPHDQALFLEICNEKLRPKIPRNTPALVIELIQKCWDDNPQNRLSSCELSNIFRVWRNYHEGSELDKQIKESIKMASGPIDDGKIHPKAIFTSRCLTDELEL